MRSFLSFAPVAFLSLSLLLCYYFYFVYFFSPLQAGKFIKSYYLFSVEFHFVSFCLSGGRATFLPILGVLSICNRGDSPFEGGVVGALQRRHPPSPRPPPHVCKVASAKSLKYHRLVTFSFPFSGISLWKLSHSCCKQKAEAFFILNSWVFTLASCRVFAFPSLLNAVNLHLFIFSVWTL